MDESELVSEYKNILLNSENEQEKYVACLHLYNFYEERKEVEKGLFYCMESYLYDQQRVEGIYYLILYHLWNENASLAHKYYLYVKEFYENEYLSLKIDISTNKLDVNHMIYDFYLPYHMMFVSDKTGDYETALKMIKIILTTKPNYFDDWWINNFLHNIQFFIPHIPEDELSIFSTLFLEYIAFLKENNYSFENHDFLSQNEYKKLGLNPEQSQESQEQQEPAAEEEPSTPLTPPKPTKYSFFAQIISEYPISTLYEFGENNSEWETDRTLVLNTTTPTTTPLTIHKIPNNEMIYDHYVLYDLPNPQIIKIGKDCKIETIKKNIDMINRSKYVVIDCDGDDEKQIDKIHSFLVKNEDWVLWEHPENEKENDVFYFKNMKHDDGYLWIFYMPEWYLDSLGDYFDGLISVYKGIFHTKDANEIYALRPDKVTFIFDLENKELIKHCLERGLKLSLLNTEPLTITKRLYDFLNQIVNYPNLKIYDYSRSNMEIFSKMGVKNVEHLSYFVSEHEKNKLTTFKTEIEKQYDFGIISHSDPIYCERRRNVVDYLRALGYSVNIVVGWGDERDIELSKCKIILNIHGWFITDETRIFEHIRCDRLLYSGHCILSEESNFLNEAFQQRFSNLKLIPYNDFFNLDTYQGVTNKTAEKIKEWLL